MRIVQLIDSLETGGAERMAVNYANSLSNKIEFSALISTRREGALLEKLDAKVNYLFLNKKSTFDFSALSKLISFCKTHKVSFIHAHSSSCFFAVVTKIFLPKIKIVWHDHHGNSNFLQNRKSFPIKLMSCFFTGIISVNKKLENWASQKLFCRKTVFLYNFASIEKEEAKTILHGKENSKIVCLANLRPQKNINFLLQIASKVTKSYNNHTFHVVGKHFNDNYQNELFTNLKTLNLQDKVFFYDNVSDVKNVLKQANIAVLTSVSEGLPLAILEYGIVGLPIVSTNVGDVVEVIKDNENGFLVESNNLIEFIEKLEFLIENSSLRNKFSDGIKQTIEEKFSEETIITKYLQFLNDC